MDREAQRLVASQSALEHAAMLPRELRDVIVDWIVAIQLQERHDLLTFSTNTSGVALVRSGLLDASFTRKHRRDILRDTTLIVHANL